MALRQRALSRRGRRHAAAETPEHAQDKAIAAARRATSWVPVSNAPDTDEEGHTPVHPLGLGFQFRVIEGELVPCSADEFVKHLDGVENERDWYWGQMKRNGVMTTVRRKRPGAIDQIAVSYAPWQSEFLRYAAQVDGGKYAPLVRKLYRAGGEKAAAKLKELTGRDVVGVSVHLDTSTDHTELQFSRVSTKNELLGEHRGLHTGGGWLAGVKRQIDAGGVPQDCEKYRLYERNMASFTARNEGKIPLEIALNDVIDAEFETVFGKTEFAQKCRENYALTVMATESATLENEVAKLEMKVQALREEIALRDAEMASPHTVVATPRPATPTRDFPDLS